MWDLFVRVVREKERVWRLKAIEDWSCFRMYLVSKLPAKWSMCPIHDWNVKSQDRIKTTGFHKCLVGKAFPRDTHKTFCFAELSILIHSILIHTIYTPITHTCWGVLLRENSSHKPWELEIVIPTILYTIACGFSSTPNSPFSYHWEIDSPNIYHTLSECQVRIWCCWEAFEEARFWQMQLGALWDLES